MRKKYFVLKKEYCAQKNICDCRHYEFSKVNLRKRNYEQEFSKTNFRKRTFENELSKTNFRKRTFEKRIFENEILKSFLKTQNPKNRESEKNPKSSHLKYIIAFLNCYIVMRLRG